MHAGGDADGEREVNGVGAMVRGWPAVVFLTASGVTATTMGGFSQKMGQKDGEGRGCREYFGVLSL